MNNTHTLHWSVRVLFFSALFSASLFLAFFFLNNAYSAVWTLRADIVAVGPFEGDSAVGIMSNVRMEDEEAFHMAYCATASHDPKYAFVDGTGVVFREQIYNGGGTPATCTLGFGRKLSLDLDGTLPVVAMYHNVSSDHRVLLGRRDGAGVGNGMDSDWNVLTIATGTAGLAMLDLDIRDGQYGVAFSGSESAMVALCQEDCGDTNSWTREVVDSSAAVIGRSISIAFLSTGTPVISYFDSTNEKLKYAIRNGAGAGNCTHAEWNCYVVDDVGTSVDQNSSTSIDVSASDIIGIAYLGIDTSMLRYAYQDQEGSGCNGDVDALFSCETVGQANGSAHPSLRIDGHRPFISYHIDTVTVAGDTQDLRVAYKDDGVWTIETAASTGNVGKTSHIDRYGDRIAVAFFDDTLDRAKLVTADIAFNEEPDISFDEAPVQTSATGVAVEIVVSDPDMQETSVTLEYSLDEDTWLPATITSVVASEGAPTIDPGGGLLTGVATDLDTVALSLIWGIGIDLNDQEHSNVVLRVRASDGDLFSQYEISDFFDIDTAAPSAVGELSFFSVTTSSLVFGFPELMATDQNFREYIISYDTEEMPDAFSLTSEDDPQLESPTFNGGEESVPVTNLIPNTLYYARISAFDIWNGISFSEVSSTSTLPVSPILAEPSVRTATTTEMSFTALGNPAETVYAFYEQETEQFLSIDREFSEEEPVYFTLSEWEDDTVISGLTPGTEYCVQVIAYSLTFVPYPSNTVCFYTKAQAPQGVLLTVLTANSIEVSWEEGENPETVEYAVYSPTVDSFALRIKNIFEVGEPIPEPFTAWEFPFLITNLEPTTIYCIEIFAYSADDEVTSSEAVCATTPEADQPPSPGGSPSVPSAPSPPKPTPSSPTQDPKNCKKNDPLCGTEKDLFLPTGLVSLVDPVTLIPLKYTNKVNVSALFDTTYSDLVSYFISHGAPSTDFSGKTFGPIRPRASVVLSGGDGKKCINARFYNSKQGFTYTTYACVILDTTPPAAPLLGNVASGGTKDLVLLSGVAEPLSSIVLKRKTVPTGSVPATDIALKIGIKNNIFIPTLNVLGSLIPAAMDFIVDEYDTVSPWESFFEKSIKKPLFQVALVDIGATGSGIFTTTTEVPESGVFTLPLPVGGVAEVFDTSVYTVDIAGNTSPPLSFAVTIEDLPPDIVEPEEEEVIEEPLEEEDAEDPVAPPDLPQAPVDSGDAGSSSQDSSGTGISGNAEDGSGSSGFFTELFGNSTSSSSEGESSLLVGVLGEFFQGFVPLVRSVVSQIQRFMDDPEVERIAEEYVAPAVAVAMVVNTAFVLSLPQILAFLHYIFGQPLLLLRLRKQKSWGIVYHAFTKRPIDLAVVRLINLDTNKIVQSRVTDRLGRYVFFAPAGRYRIEVLKEGFEGFAEHTRRYTEDGEYHNLYHGEEITLEKSDTFLRYAIALDPILDRPTTRILRDHAKKVFQTMFAWFGIIFSGVLFLITPTLLMTVFFVMNLLVFAAFYRVVHSAIGHVFGTVVSLLDKDPIGRVVIRVFDAAYDRLVDTHVTDRKGRYAALVGPSTYYVVYEKQGYERKKSPTLDYSSQKTKGEGGIIARNELLKKIKKSDARTSAA